VISDGPRSEIQALNMYGVTDRTFVGAFTAGLDGAVFLFVNETMISRNGVTAEFYKNNRGSATVKIERF